jgi:two-component system capsular synthesis response regulator RcsB
MSIGAFLADDHPIVRSSVRLELLRSFGVSVVGEAATTDELMTFMRTGSCDLLVTDFNMPGAENEDGLSMLDSIRELHPRLPILVLTMLTNSGLLCAIYERGVAAIVSKSDGMAELSNGLKAMLDGEHFLSTNVRNMLNMKEDQHSPISPSLLTEREAEVLRLFVGGRTISQIAAQRNRSVKTVSHQKISAMTKLGLRNDPELYAYAHRHGFLS